MRPAGQRGWRSGRSLRPSETSLDASLPARPFSRGSGTRARHQNIDRTSRRRPANAAGAGIGRRADVITSSISNTRFADDMAPHANARTANAPATSAARSAADFSPSDSVARSATQRIQAAGRPPGDPADRLRQQRRLVIAAMEQPRAMQRHRHQQLGLRATAPHPRAPCAAPAPRRARCGRRA